VTQDEHLELQELLGAYVLHALDADEVALVEEHLPACPKCRAEVDELREVTAHLAQAGAPAPEGVWDRIAERIAAAEAAPPPMRLVLGGADGPAGGSTSTPAAPARSRGRGRFLRPLSIAAAVLVLAGLSFQVVRQQQQIADVRAAGDIRAEFASYVAMPGARTTNLVDGDGRPLAVAVVLPDGEGILQAEGLPDLDGGVYQLWGTDGETVVSLRVVDPHGDVVAFDADPATTALMITAEDAPVAQSSNPPVVQGRLA
jgi:anti-sigma factor RsiW